MVHYKNNMSDIYGTGRSIMKKYIKILLTLCIVLGVFSMTAYAEDEDKKPFEYKDEEIISTVQGILTEVDAFTTAELEYYADNSLGITKTVCEEYLEYEKNDTLGDFVEFKSSDIEDTKDSAIVTITAVYEKKELTMTATYKVIGNQIVPTDIEMKLSDESGSEGTSKLDAIKNAGLNTLMGITIVVLMLLVISYLISLFKIIPKIQEKFAKKKDNRGKELTSVENVVAQIEEKEELSDDTELVAVITAAICEATGSSSDGFVVRSIRKRRLR